MWSNVVRRARVCHRGFHVLPGSRRISGRGRARAASRARRRCPSPRDVDAADDRGGHLARLAEHELCGAGDLVGDRDLRRLELAARARPSCPRRSRSGAIPATPSATSVVPCRQARPNESLTITPTSAPGQLAQPVAQPARGGVRIDGSRTSVPVARRVRRVDAGRGADEAVPRLGDHERRPGADDLAALAEDHLDVARVAVRARRARPRAADGSTSASRTTRPSTFETAFCATTTTSPSSSPPARSAAACEQQRRGRRPPRAPGAPRAGSTLTLPARRHVDSADAR